MGVFTGENQLYGILVDANAGAYAARGDLTLSFRPANLFIFDFTVGGSVMSAHAGITVGAYKDGKTGDFIISGMEHLGFGVGEKAGFLLTIPKDSPIYSWPSLFE